MDHRIQKALDGELPREALTAPELAVLAAAEADIGAVLRSVPARPLPDLAPAVMRRIAAVEAGKAAAARSAPATPKIATQTVAAVHGAGQSAASSAAAGLRATLGWIWKPRPISFGWRPAYGFAAAAMLVVMLVIGRETAPAGDGTQAVLTQFVLNAPDAQQVMLAGDFTGWQPAHTMTRTGPGVWTVVVALEPGVHSYAFVVDGDHWVPDPNAPAVDDGFGGLNSRLAVLAPDGGES